MDPRLLEEYHILNTIIEQDKAVTSFKYALLRGTIEICQQYSHLADPDEERVWYPLGLLIERWILYYYPIFENERFIPQLNGEKNLDEPSKKVLFRRELSEIIEYYRLNGGFSAFYTDYRRGTIPENLNQPMRDLIKKVRIAITDGPIQHLGYSYHGDYYSVFDWDRSHLRLPKGHISCEYLINHGGKFSMHRDLSSLFQYFGSFIIGEGTLVSKWADFTVHISKAQGQNVTKERILDLLGRSPNTERQVQEASRFYHQLLAESQGISCIWSDKLIQSHRHLHIDHLLPFSLWKNNDLWNLMPTLDSVNTQKKDAILSPSLLKKREDSILHYWHLLSNTYQDTFRKEITSALIGTYTKNDKEMMDMAFQNLIDKCWYLIDIRGYAAWNP